MKQMTAVRMALCSLFTALIAIGAFLQIPLPNFDYFTLQFFFVLMAGMLLGARLGALSAALYVLIGLLGIPVFAAGGGISYVLRPSFAAAGLCSMGKENGRHAFWLYWQDCWQPMESDLLINM